jgi:hypothetical protein
MRWVGETRVEPEHAERLAAFDRFESRQEQLVELGVLTHVLTEEYFVFTAVPSVTSAAATTTAISATSSAYSIMVAPSSSRMNAARVVWIFFMKDS